jgi:hypothetical protein
VTHSRSLATTFLTAIFILAALLRPSPAGAQVPELVPGTLNMFRDTRAANDVGIAAGDRFQFGADIVGGSEFTRLWAIYLPDGFATPPGPCGPLAVNPNFCSRSTTFDPDRLGQWALIFENATGTVSVAAPSLAGTEAPVPFPQDVTASGTGITPTFSWTLPGGFQPDALRLSIHDKDDINSAGFADVIHTVPISPTSTSYTLPEVLNSGQSLVEGGHYTINFQLIETRGHVPFTNNNAQILRRSSSFFAFSPLPDSAPPEVALPTIVDGVYSFSVTQVGPNSVTFIDPPVAIGYDYAIGPGDPKFKSVRLPEAGDSLYDLYRWTGSAYAFHSTVMANDDVDLTSLDPGGVDRFRILGIEPSAGLDPANPTAFITGLTFVSSGQFTGTMTPITTDLLPRFFLHGSGGTANPPTLTLDESSPTSTTAKFKDSGPVRFGGGNAWQEIGRWSAGPVEGSLGALSDLQVWLGLKNSDDQGTRFDLRAEIYRNDELVVAGQTRCIEGITRNANKAKAAAVVFNPFAPADFNGAMDELTLTVLTRIGTNADGTKCGGHSNAVGLRLYFDAVNRASQFGAMAP